MRKERKEASGSSWEVPRHPASMKDNRGHAASQTLQQSNFQEELSYQLSPPDWQSCLPHHPVCMPTSFQEHSCPGFHIDRPHLLSAYSPLPELHRVNFKLLESFPPLEVNYTPLSFPPPSGPSQHPLQDICLISLNWLRCSQLLRDGIPWSKFPFTHIL